MTRSPDLFSAGGISGTALELFPGVTAGQQRRTFGVRGYPAGAEGGIRAYSAAVEYRAPLAAPSRGFRFIPVFVDRTSLTLFGETGRAFCPASADITNGVCSAGNIGNPVMTSAGAELNIDTGLQLDVQARMRLGLAFPLANRRAGGREQGAGVRHLRRFVLNRPARVSKQTDVFDAPCRPAIGPRRSRWTRSADAWRFSDLTPGLRCT